MSSESDRYRKKQSSRIAQIQRKPEKVAESFCRYRVRLSKGWGKSSVYMHKRPDKFKEIFVNKSILEKLATRVLAEETSKGLCQ